jgi:hypothetical protein
LLARVVRSFSNTKTSFQNALRVSDDECGFLKILRALFGGKTKSCMLNTFKTI